MDYVKHESDLIDVLNTPGIARHEQPSLNPETAMDVLQTAYSQMATIFYFSSISIHPMQLGRFRKLLKMMNLTTAGRSNIIH
ncbi:predicted protein [Uncinocarpus reesii 1704]|uniref:Uncharacterized protein n=1 Tax=Uncinocarpus reesii (strain UAMH 1704) TaxID=336963 RepID=C4JP92_UNCRE|nr:uncharacterized protein UREG_04474 [Uncinocarpus reesii 1704]EEP79628.1 predicted protein [Uncinocarpus reesii 1704]